MTKYLYIDFEYNESQSKHMGLVSAAMTDGNRVFDYWLADGSENAKCKKVLKRMTGRTVVCFNADAEARCFVALGLDPLEYKWIDLYLDYKQLQNKDIEHQFGRYMVYGSFGTPRAVATSRGYQNKSIGEYQSKADFQRVRAIHKTNMAKKGLTVEPVTASLLTATLNFTSISDADAITDARQKNTVRDIIIDNKKRNYSPDDKEKIMAYGRSDIKDMKEIMENMGKALEVASKQSSDDVLAHRLFRGRVGMMMAVVSSTGTPICLESLDNLTKNAWDIENNSKAELNIRTGHPFCQWKAVGKKTNTWHFSTFSASPSAFTAFVESVPTLNKNWPRNADNNCSKSKDVIEKYKAHPVIKQYRSMIKTCTAMRSSKPHKVTGKSPLNGNIGDDGRLRCPLFPYTAQTGRNQPKTTTYIYGQGAWIKAALINVPKGYKLVETDYSSQEFLIGGILSGDEKMIEAYKTDVYISFGVVAKRFPSFCDGLSVTEIKKISHNTLEDGETPTPEAQKVADARQSLKAVVLGMSYGAGAETLSVNTGLPIADVEKLIAQYKKHYKVYYKWRENVWSRHISKGRKPLTMSLSGWYMGKDNDNKLSTQNFPVQASGATLLHVALDKVLTAGVQVINTLHDAIYYLVPEDDTTTVEMVEKLMLDASEELFGRDGMKIESEEWAHKKRVITPKGRKDWEMYKKYVDPELANKG